MLSINDIQNITFSKSMNGYKSTEVNVFINECAKTVEVLTREKEDLEKKLEILAGRLVEYRDDEDSIRAALLNAQRLGDTTVREANHKAGLILEDAQTKADSILKKAEENAEKLIGDADAYAAKLKDDARSNIIQEHEALELLKKNVSDFKFKMLSIYQEHLEQIDKIPEVKEIPISTEEDSTISDESEDLPENSKEEVSEQAETNLINESDLVDDADTADSSDDIVDATDLVYSSAAQPDLDRVQVQTVFTKKGEDVSRDEGEKFKNLKFGEDYDINRDEEEESGGFFRRKK